MTALRHIAAMRHVQLAMAAAGASLVIATIAAVNAARLEPLPHADADPPRGIAALQAASRTPLDVIDEAVAAAPFTPGRVPAGASSQEQAAPPVESQMVTLVGTVVGDDGDSFVLVSAGTGPAKVVRVGGTFEGLRLSSVGQASAVFTNVQTGERLELRVPRSRR